MKQEIWKDLPNPYTGIYQISNLGRVMRIAPAGGTRVGKILKPLIHKGYSHVALCVNGKVKNEFIHRLIGYAFLGLTPDKQINHKNLNTLDNNINNLEVVTGSENMKHAVDNGALIPPTVYFFGEANPMSKLTSEKVIRMRQMHKTGNYTHKELASIFDVDRRTVTKVVNYRSWRHL